MQQKQTQADEENQTDQKYNTQLTKELKDKCLKLLRAYTKHDVVKITTSGDAAIFGALAIAKQRGIKTVLVPDQGGWLTYLTFPKILDMDIVELKTDYGLLVPSVLEKEAKRYSHCVLLFSSFAGYAAPQNITDIANVCQKHQILMIEDASGALGHDTLCNGTLSDIILGSFGKWKIADVGHGGFLSCKKGIITPEIKELDILSLVQEKQMNYALLLEKLMRVPQRLASIFEKTKEIKTLCKKEHFDLIHEDAQGLSVFVRFHTDEEKEKILAFCKTHHIEYKECPLYIKVLEKAISLEIKRMDL